MMDSQATPTAADLTANSTSLSGVFRAIFYGLTQESLETLREVAEKRRYPEGTVLCEQGEPGDTFYVVVKGEVLITQKLADGTIVELGRCSAGQYFGEMALLDNTTRLATCITVQPTTVLEVTAEKFNHLAQSSPAIAYSLTTKLLKNMRANDARAIDTLIEKNNELAVAYQELQNAQLELIKHERIRRDLEIAIQIQHSLLPEELPQVDQFDFASHVQFNQRAGRHFFDVTELDDDHVGILLGDIVDKGIHVYVFMAVMRTLFMTEGTRSLSPAEVMKAVNYGLLKVSTRKDIFVSAFYGVLKCSTGELRYVIAGEGRPFLAHQDKSITILGKPGRLLGMGEGYQSEEQTTLLNPHECLLLYSESVANAINEEGRHFDPVQLQPILVANPPPTAQRIVDEAVAALHHWTTDGRPADDYALLAITAKG